MAGYKRRMSLAERKNERQIAAEDRYDSLARRDRLDREDLVNALRGELCPAMGERYGRLIVEKDLWTDALALAFHNDSRVAFRASWALEWAYFNRIEHFAPFIPQFFDNYIKAENPSVRRHYTKMLCDMMRRKLFVPDTSQVEQIAEKAFDLLIDPDTRSAVRVWAAEILFDLSPWLDWVGEHLEAVLVQQIETIPAPAILNHYRKLLGRIAALRR